MKRYHENCASCTCAYPVRVVEEPQATDAGALACVLCGGSGYLIGSEHEYNVRCPDCQPAERGK